MTEGVGGGGSGLAGARPHGACGTARRSEKQQTASQDQNQRWYSTDAQGVQKMEASTEKGGARLGELLLRLYLAQDTQDGDLHKCPTALTLIKASPLRPPSPDGRGLITAAAGN